MTALQRFRWPQPSDVAAVAPCDLDALVRRYSDVVAFIRETLGRYDLLDSVAAVIPHDSPHVPVPLADEHTEIIAFVRLCDLPQVGAIENTHAVEVASVRLGQLHGVATVAVPRENVAALYQVAAALTRTMHRSQAFGRGHQDRDPGDFEREPESVKVEKNILARATR